MTAPEQEVKATPKKEKKAKNGGETAAPKARTSKVFEASKKITLLAEKNPKRVGSKAHATFELYSKSATVGEFIANGGFYGALEWDAARGFVSVEGYTPKMVEKKAKAPKAPKAEAQPETPAA